MKAFYASKGRLFTLDVAYGDREELRDYHRKKRQQEEEQRQRMYAAGVFGGHDLSFPGVEFRMPEDGSSDIYLTDRMSGFLQRGFSGTLRIGQRLTPKEIEPYAYEADRQAGQFIARRIDTASGSIWAASVPEQIDFIRLYRKSIGTREEWTTIKQEFPVKLEIK